MLLVHHLIYLQDLLNPLFLSVHMMLLVGLGADKTLSTCVGCRFYGLLVPFKVKKM